MKTNSARIVLIRVILFFIFPLCSLTLSAQPDYVFTNGFWINGPAGYQTGSVYQFNSVRPGVDATVTINSVSPGIVVDYLDGGSGYDEALQPALISSPFSYGYLEMKIDLFVQGTNNPYTAAEIPVTCIDVDGYADHQSSGLPLYEFDEVNLGGGYFESSTMGGEIMVSQVGNWFTGKNFGGIDYPGRDTSIRKVMFSVINANVSSFIIRVGVDNRSPVEGYRLRSVYFKKFQYDHFPLRLPKIQGFSGTLSGNKVTLKWSLETGVDWNECILERCNSGKNFQSVAVFLPGQVNFDTYNYNDYVVQGDNFYYRLKLISHDGEIKYSNILAFKTGNENNIKSMSVYPSLVTDHFTVKFSAERDETTQLQVIDYSGKQVYNRVVSLKKGENNIAVTDFSAQRGNFMIILRSVNGMHSQKIIVQ